MDNPETRSLSGYRPRVGTLGLIAISLVLLGYTAFRAANLAFTHDESITYQDYVLPGPLAIFDCYDANNHPFNTALMILSRAVLGDSVLALRLPSLLAHVAYLIFAGLLSRQFPRFPSQMASFLILTTNPYLLEFFSLARGYAWAATAQLGAVHFFLTYYRNGRNQRHLITALHLAALSVFSNYSFLICYLAFFATYLIVEILSQSSPLRSTSFKAAIKPIWKHLVLHALILIPPILNLRMQGALYFGGTTSFARDTLGTTIRSVLYNTPDTISETLALWLFLILITATWTVPLCLRRQRRIAIFEWFIPLLLTMVIAGAYLIHLLFHVPSPMDRSALYLIPLYSLALVSLCGSIQVTRSSGSSPISSILLGGGVVLALGSMSGACNLTHTRDWIANADTHAILQDIEQDHATTQTRINLGVSWIYEPSFNFYRAAQHMNWLEPVDPDGLAKGVDYLIFTPDDAPSLLEDPRVIPIRTYPISGATLARFEDTGQR